MFIKKNEYLKDIKRVRIPETRDLINGLRLDRNEKVDNWPDNFFTDVLNSKPKAFFSCYPDISGLYMRLSNHLNVPEDFILVTSGIDGGIKTLFEILVEPGDVVGVLSPTYAMYDVYSKLFQAEMIHIDYNLDHTVNWDKFDVFLTRSPRMLFLPNPNQPIESCFSLDELREIASQCLKVNCLLVIDEAYHYFGADSSVPLINEFENVVVVRTFSKAFGIPSARLGYMISNRSNMELLSKTRFAHEANSISIAMAEYLLDHFNIVNESIKKINISRGYIKGELNRLGYYNFSDKGNYVLIQMENEDLVKKCVHYLRENKIYVKGPWVAPWNNSFTITLGPKDLMERFVSALESFRSF